MLMNTDYANFIFLSKRQTGEYNRVVMTWARIRIMWGKIMGKQSQGVREETIWMSVNGLTGENGSLEGDKSDGLNAGNQGECEE